MAGCWIFLDLETGGPDPLYGGLDPKGQILEIALVAVDNRLNEVAHWTSVIRPSCVDWRIIMPPRVIEMNDGSGLTRDIQRHEPHAVPFAQGGLPTEAEAEAVGCAFMAQYAPGRSSPMCGANVGRFDARWIYRRMPRLYGAFNHRCIDTNFAFLTEQFFANAPSFKGETRHRALDDARQSIATLRRFFGAT
jgi:oligoribonuclease (3'-5' exoribonuclease)